MKKILFTLVLISFLILPVIALNAQGQAQEPTLEEIIRRIAVYLMWLLLTVAVIFFIIAGYLFVTATGNPEQYEKAKKMVLYGLIGVLVALAGPILVRTVQRIFKMVPSSPFETVLDFLSRYFS